MTDQEEQRGELRVWAGCGFKDVTVIVSDGRLVVRPGTVFAVECVPEYREVLANALIELARCLMSATPAPTPHSDGLPPHEQVIVEPNPQDLEERHG